MDSINGATKNIKIIIGDTKELDIHSEMVAHVLHSIIGTGR